jgi:DNA-binding MarR family transcriptional regulator
MARKPDNSAVKTSGCICFRLRKAARCVTQIYDQHLEPLGLTITQYGLLGHILSNDGIGIGALAEMVIMDPTTLTRSLRPLQRKGLVALAQDPQDRRSRRLYLTDKGREAFAEAKPAWKRAQEQIEDALGDAQTAVLNTVLDVAVERLAK